MRKIENLFPIPIMLDTLSRDLTDDELSYFRSLETVENNLNRRSADSYILDSSELLNLKKFIEDAVNFYFLEMHKPPAGTEIYITQSWLNISDTGEQHHIHNHPNSFISGTFYVSADKEIDSIYFSKTDFSPIRIIPTSYNFYNSPAWFYPIGSGDLILFPSTLHHYVGVVKESLKRKERLSLSFNTFLKGALGSKELLSEILL